MKESKIKTCKYPNCNKEVPSDKSLFCMEHSRSLKEKRNLVGMFNHVIVKKRDTSYKKIDVIIICYYSYCMVN
ncbi:hypothetical protein FKY93_13585 [Enterococcus faecalis]|nr:hypothetical protein FKY93_13585 [Enterococcus faecalis]